ncbi:MAG: class I SAM-dependent methyltransferase, partial [Saccharofermentanales bacterium]
MEKHDISNFEKFTDKVELYAKYRPGYPNEFIEYLCDDIGISPYSIIADIGSGTGILSRLLLEQGCKVYCIEPNHSMRRVAEHALSGFPDFVSVNAMAENTGLPDDSIDFITVAQAFHWFDLEKFRLECQRILKPGGKVILVWNSKVEEDPVTIDRSVEKPDNYVAFFRDGIFETKEFENDFYGDLENFIGGNLSSSYAPKVGDKC